MEEKLDTILQSLSRIEDRLKRLECYCKENEHNFIREVGANVLGEYIYSIIDDTLIRKDK